MKNQTGLADRARFEAFSRQWRDTALKEAEKWSSDEKVAQLLADAVLTDFRNKYADSDPPSNLEYYFRAQVCLLYSMTGQNVQKLESYAAEHAFPEEPETPIKVIVRPKVQPEQDRQSGQAPEKQSGTPPAPVSESVSAAGPAPAAPPEEAIVQAERAAIPPEASDVSPKEPAAELAVPDAGAAAEKKADLAPDTFLDPVRTTFWTPDNDQNEHVIQEIELPDEEDEERSVIISFINTILFLLTAGSFAFCVYETGFLQYLLQ